MPTFKETVLAMVARKELSAAQAMMLIQQVRESRATATPAAREPIAIIGMSARFPGAGDVDTFWSNIRNGISSVTEIPSERWNVADLYDPDPQASGRTYCKWGGFLDGIDEFDAAFFNISSREAQFTDPQQRLFLEEAYRALEDAGLSAAQLDGIRCAVFAGAGGGDFIHQISAEGIAPDAYAFMGNASSILAARISYHLNLKGPSIAVDTACSSSLVAMHLACESLTLGTSDVALAGGVCVLNTPNFYLAGSKAGMLSKGGACRTFDAEADGFVPAEGAGVIVLKRLSRAVADGDNIHGVIEGSAINQDGRTNGITAPSAPSQMALELEVYERFGISPGTIGYVEAHGTGTRLGDPIEIQALTSAFRRHTDARGFCAIGSSKTNIGHAMSASGVAGVVKVLKAMQAGELPPSLHFERRNDAIDFETTPFRVNTSLEPWPEPAGDRRRAAVSSFGFSGTNAHIVIGSPPRRDLPAERIGELPFVVSAKSRAALEANCAALADWLERQPSVRLDSVSYTLLAGRTRFARTVILRAATVEELVALLRGPLSETTEAAPDVRALFGEAPPPKIPLPTYRFERRSHSLGTATRPKVLEASHPLLDEGSREIFRSRWNDQFPFLRDHRVQGRPILPGACLVEMALAATRAQVLRNLVFRAPLQLTGREIAVELQLEGGGAFTFLSDGRAIATGRTDDANSNPTGTIDIDEWTSAAADDTDALFARFEAAGVILGPYCRGLRRLWLREDEAFAELQLPAGEARSLPYYKLHPTLVDGAFQAAMALLSSRAEGVLVPASIASIEIGNTLPAICYAHVRLTGARTFDVTFADENGTTLAAIRGFGVSELRAPSAEPALRFYRPAWIEAPPPAQNESMAGVTLFVRAPDVSFDANAPSPSLDVVLAEQTASLGAGEWQIDAASASDFDRLISDLKPLSKVVFLGGRADAGRDVVALLHLVHALARRSESEPPLPIVIAAPPENGAVLGFAQTVSRETAHLRFTVIECDAASIDLLHETGEAPGVMLALRDGRRLRRTLEEHPAPAVDTHDDGRERSRVPFRHGGVYVIAGGAGGIGLELARHLATNHDAHVVLLGRRELSPQDDERIVYRRVDITDAAAIRQVISEVKERHGAIHGVIHAAMVLRDVLAENMNDAALRAVLAPKLDGSRVLCDVFATEPLDFFAFFSSANSFFGNAGQSNYAAASMAQDAIARRFALHAPFPVRIVNWGFWGDVGAVATPLHRKRALEHGIGAIGVAEGLRAFEACLAGDELQLMPMKVEPHTLARMGMLTVVEDEDAAIARAFANVENYGRAQLRRHIDAQGRLTLQVAPKYARLHDALEAIAARPVEAHEKPLDGWTAPFARLIDRCFDHYPAVLSGTKNPAEVLFPGGSSEWVAPLYRDNPIVDRYNRLVADEVLAQVAELLATRDRIRIFEMGAGTGGTSRGLLRVLAPHASRIEFVFSDLSPALVRQAKAELGAEYPFARFATFDMEKPPASQGFEEQAYDLVLASNAIHATRNIAASLRNARALLRDGGVCILNEATRLHDFSTLTFGLTDGWWLFDDASARLPHSPLLDEPLWRAALQEAFDGVEIRGRSDGASQAVFIARARPLQSRITVGDAVGDTAQLERTVRRHTASVLSISVSEIDVDRRFSELGIDSILGVDLVERINAALRTTIPVTVLFDHPSVRLLAKHLSTLTISEEREMPQGDVASKPEPLPVSAAPLRLSRDIPIAVVGLAGRFPGSRNAGEFWRDLRNGVSRIGVVPRERWDVHRYYDPDPTKEGKSPCKWGGFLENIDEFDPTFFHMSGAEAEYTDPQQRLFVQEAWHALEDAGYAPSWLDGTRCGVFVGAGAGDYIHRMNAREPQPQAFLGNGVSVLASRISYLLNLRGPAIAIDTACSSSLLAVHLACQSIRSGECDLALAGGVFVSTTSAFHYLTGRLGMLSPTGSCRAFDDAADGFIPGEGAGVVVLRPLDAALRDGDFVYGVIAGSGANQDGHSNGITAPSAQSQADLEADVYTRAGIDPRTIGYVEAHGTGTKLGDPIELQGLTNAFRRFTADRGFCAIGSVKTNIGHAGAAAGIAGMIKVLLAMRNRELPPSLGFERPNRVIDFASSPFYVATDRRPWPQNPMRAAVSAFGLSGTNVHIVLDEAPAPEQRPRNVSRAPLFAVSAMTAESLRERVTELEAWLAEHGHEHDPQDVAYTLTVGRKHFGHRAVINAPANDALVAGYLNGEDIDWAAVYPQAQHRRVPLPGYPFSRERYWISDPAEDAIRSAPRTNAEVCTYARRWVAAPSGPAALAKPVAIIGATETELARLQSTLGERVQREVGGAMSIVLMPGAFQSVEGYLDVARRSEMAERVVVAHAPGEHAAIATSALHQSLRHVHPRVLWQTLETGTDPIADIARELGVQPHAAEVRYTAGLREEHHCVPLRLAPGSAALPRGATWWLTGGTGRIGTLVARSLVERFDARVVVTGRRAPSQPLGRNIEFIAADVADRAAMRRVRDTILERYGKLNGVIHAAGFVEPALLSAKRDSAAVLAPKIDGVLILDELTRELALDCFVLFSSLSAIAGDFGQCDYAAANRYLESFAGWRAARRPGRTVAIHWPLWSEGGMHLPETDERRYLEAAGLESLATEAALRVLEESLLAAEPVIVVANGDRMKIDALLGIRATSAATDGIRASDPVRQPVGSAAELAGVILERTATIVRLPESRLSPDSRFSDVGLDSLYMKDLAAALGSKLGIAISPTAFFEHQTIGALAEHLWSTCGSTLAERRVAQDEATPVHATTQADEPIAIIGMSGRFPQSRDVSEYWAHLAAGDDCITEIPVERWNWRDFESVTGREHDKSISRWGGFMPDLDRFDCAFFGISPREAIYMDPQHRLFLQSVWGAFEDAGVRPSTVAGRNVGVWVGAQLNEYMRLIGDAGEAAAQAALGNTQTMLANRASYWFDLRGPSQTVDTACSSSLVAVHRAVQALRSGECELAIAGGVSAILSPDTYVLASQLGMLSPDGRCRTFDREANGYVKGEGVGTVLLKPLSRAIADGDHVYGVVRSSAEGHGGKASSLTAPNPQAQAQVVADAWRRSNLPIETVSYIETHGTGTELGDPIEIDALTTAFRNLATEQKAALRPGFCGLGSVKSNIGHLEPAAGIAGLIKVLLAMEKRELPPTLHVRDVNPYLHLDASPFHLVTAPEPWSAVPMRAGISAFGFGGSNAHVVLEEAPSRAMEPDDAFEAVIPLSAKTPEALREIVQSLAQSLPESNAQWADVAFTLCEGRERFAHTIAFTASSVAELVTRLHAWLSGVSATVPHTVIPTPRQGRRIPLPTYPFARTRIWFDRKTAAPEGAVAAVTPAVIPAAAPEMPRPEPPPIVPTGTRGNEIRAMLAELLYLEPSSIDDDARFVDLGLDSILAVEFAKKLKDRFGIDLRATRLYDYTTVHDLAEYLDGGPETAAVAAATPVAKEPPPAATAHSVEEIRSMLAELLYLEPSSIDDEARFVDLGLDSILAVEFAKKLKDRFAIDLRATRLYDYSTVADLASYVSSQGVTVTPAAESQVEPRDSETIQLSRATDVVESAISRDQHVAPAPVQTPAHPGAMACLEEIRTILADFLSLDPSDIDDDARFVDLGLDSIVIVEFAKRLKERFAIDVRAARLYDYATVADLAGYIGSRREETSPAVSRDPAKLRTGNTTDGQERQPQERDVSPADPQPAPREEARIAVEATRTAVEVRERDIAIIGMSGRFPGADTLAEFWTLLASGTDATTDFPERFDIDSYYDPDPSVPNKTYCRRGGFLRDVDKFDALFFNISPREAEQMDPQQRLFLEESWKALEDAGYGDAALSNTRCSVFVGVAGGDYGHGGSLGAQIMLGNSSSILASRISYFLNLKGASVAVDTACSSSLVALHLACQNILSGESDMALAGGVNIMTTPMVFVMTSQARMVAPDGRCKSFDERADGFVPAEAVGVVVLKSLSKAIADGDHIHAVVRGSRMNQDGKTSGITAPSALSQTALELAVYETSGVNPATITCVEAHGTGTKLGDPIEVDALTDAFRRYTDATRYCAIGAVKTNMGHALSAAGIASIVKMALALRHRQIPPSIHFERPNPEIDFANSPFYVNTTLQPWKPAPGAPRRAAISSFGFSGTNAHVVLEEPPARPERTGQQGGPFLMPLSAKTADALRARIVQLAEWLTQEGGSCSLADLSFTLGAGRSHFAYRAAIVAENHADLARKLASLRDGGSASDCIVGDGSVRRTLTSVLATALRDLETQRTNGSTTGSRRRETLLTIAECYAAGCAVDWRATFPSGTARRIPLPTYPFSRNRHWFPAPDVQPAPLRGEGSMHPLIGRVVPTLDGALFETDLTRDHWLVSDHVVQGRPMLPGAAYLEIARAAGAALGQPVTHLRNVVWQTPCVITSDRQQVTTRLWRDHERICWEIASAGNGDATVHATGEIDSRSPEPVAVADLDAISARLPHEWESRDIYPTFESLGIAFGTQFRRLRWLGGSDREALGRLDSEAPAGGSDADYVLYPPLLDAALQAMIGVHAPEAPGDTTGDATLAVPFAVDEVVLHGALTSAAYAHVRRTNALATGSGTSSFDISILDEAGRVLVTLSNFAVRRLSEESAAGNAMTYLSPTWKRAPDTQSSSETDAGPLLVVRADDDLGIVALLTERYGHDATGNRIRQIAIGAGGLNSLSSFSKLAGCSAVWFLGGIPQSAGNDRDAIASAVDVGARSLVRLMQAIDGLERAQRPRSLTIVTADAQCVAQDDTVRLWGTFMTGMARSIAAEYQDLRVRVVDLSGNEWRSSEAAERRRVVESIESAQGDAIETAWRSGSLHVRSSDILELPPASPERLPLRKGGVYVVVGGATGIGLTVSEWLARNYGARLLIVGRSPLDEKRSAAVVTLEAAGADVLYRQADVSDLAAMREAADAARRQWGRIDGAIHSAIVLRDRQMSRLDDAALDEVFAPKVAGSLILGEVLKDDRLDFLAVFSSAVALTGNAGQASYAAASSFIDAWALSLRETRRWPVYVINWGYWGDVGIVATPEYESRMARRGVVSISPREGIDAFARILATGRPQLAAIKVDRKDRAVQQKLGGDGVRTLRLQENSGDGAAVAVAHVIRALDAATATPPAALADHAATAESVDALDAYAAARLTDAFHRMGALTKPGEEHSRASLEATLGVQPKYRRLFGAMLDILRRRGVIEMEGDRLRATGRHPDAATVLPGAEAMVHLLDICLAECGAMLTGRISAADVLFPGSSMHLVEAIYRNNIIADYYNRLLAEAAAAVIAPGGGDRRIRFLEAGAGTGSATAVMLDRLAAHAARCEYHYTDISRAFVEYGRKTFAAAFPFVTFQPLDIQQNVARQGFEMGTFDVVVASNVLHATRDIERTLFEAKRLLRRGGVLLLNEVTAVQDATTLTFGFTDGWWLFEDAHRRRSDAPILSPSQWRAALNETGFSNARIYGLHGDASGQNIVVAESDGWVPVEKPGAAPARSAKKEPRPREAREDRSGESKRPAAMSVASIVAEVLHILPGDLDLHLPLESYGVDSIVSLDVIKRLEEVYGPQPKTLLFEYPTVDELSRYLHGSTAVAIEKPAHIAASDPLVAIDPRGSGAPSFWVHGLLGDTHWVSRLASHLRTSRPVYAFESRGASGEAAPLNTVEALAALYIASLRRVQARGPYVVGGYSFGGMIAFEIARQLTAAGERVSHLFLLDSHAPGSGALDRLREVGDEHGAWLTVGNMLASQWGAGAVLEPGSIPDGDSRERAQYIAGQLQLRARPPVSLQDLATLVERTVNVLNANGDAAGCYAPEPLSAAGLQAILFRAEDGFTSTDNALSLPRIELPDDPDHGWTRLLPAPPVIHRVASDHFGLTTARVAEVVAGAIDNALSGRVAAPAEAHGNGVVDMIDARATRVFHIVRDHVQRVLPGVASEKITLYASLRELGGNSLDRVEVATCTMQDLKVSIASTQLARVQSIGELVDVFVQHLSERADDDSMKEAT